MCSYWLRTWRPHMYTPFAYAFAYEIKQTPYAFVSKIILCMYLLYGVVKCKSSKLERLEALCILLGFQLGIILLKRLGAWLERFGARLENLGARHYTAGKARRWSFVYLIRKARSLASYGSKSSELSIIWLERLGA